MAEDLARTNEQHRKHMTSRNESFAIYTRDSAADPLTFRKTEPTMEAAVAKATEWQNAKMCQGWVVEPRA